MKKLLEVHQEKEHRENVYLGVDQPAEDPTLEETQQVTNKLKNGKAPGSNNIPEVMLKYLHKLVTCIWKEERKTSRSPMDGGEITYGQI